MMDTLRSSGLLYQQLPQWALISPLEFLLRLPSTLMFYVSMLRAALLLTPCLAQSWSTADC